MCENIFSDQPSLWFEGTEETAEQRRGEQNVTVSEIKHLTAPRSNI